VIATRKLRHFLIKIGNKPCLRSASNWLLVSFVVLCFAHMGRAILHFCSHAFHSLIYLPNQSLKPFKMTWFISEVPILPSLILCPFHPRNFLTHSLSFRIFCSHADQCITAEVNLARIYNYDVRRRREAGVS
jgi:hypothetical protein